MKRAIALAAIALVGAAIGCAREQPALERVASGRLGAVRFLRPAGAPRAFVFLISDSAGWNADWSAASERLRAAGVAVAGVDLALYLAALRSSSDGCHYVVAEFEENSERLQRGLPGATYRTPVLAGAEQGATLAYAALAQAPAATLAGAVSIAPAPALSTRVPLCPGATSTPALAGGFSYADRRDLPGFLRREGAGAAHGTEAARVANALLAELASQGEAAASPFAELPLTLLPVERESDWLAIVYSGDGGWRDVDKTIAEQLASDGVPVVGVDCLRYFWRAKSPDQVATDLALMIRHFGDAWGAGHVALIGYSFGAGILPFAYRRLPAAERARVVQLSLLGVEATAPFEFHLSGWVAESPSDAPAVLPELAQIDLSRVQCFYGEDEDDSLCPLAELARAEVIRTAGGHHFDGDYAALAERIESGVQRRLAEGAQRVTAPVTPPFTSAATRVSTIGIESGPGAAR